MSRFYLSLTDDQGTLIDRNFIDVDSENREMREPKTLEQALEHVERFGFGDDE
jgi:hypothetical protein